MGPESLFKKVENLIMETLNERESLPKNRRPIPEEKLISIVRMKFGNGDIESTVAEVISYLENGRHKIVRTTQGHLELNIWRRE